MSTGSILDGTKKILGIAPSFTAFDFDILTHINTTFAVLNQLGVGPTNGFAISGSEEVWGLYSKDELFLNSVQTYVYLKVKLWFDPPSSSYVLSAYKEQIAELEWRLNLHVETAPVDGGTSANSDSGVILDGGSA